MLTVKLVEHNGHEIVHEATEVWAEPVPEGVKDSEMEVHARKPDGDILHFGHYGVLYVMNEGGQTVAKYWLGYGEARSGKEPGKIAA